MTDLFSLVLVEDSQGNINPYAVTGFSPNSKDQNDHGTLWRENHHANSLGDMIGRKM